MEVGDDQRSVRKTQVHRDYSRLAPRRTEGKGKTRGLLRRPRQVRERRHLPGHRHPVIAGPANSLEAHLPEVTPQLDHRLPPALCRLLMRQPGLRNPKHAIGVGTQRCNLTDDQSAAAQQVYHRAGRPAGRVSDRPSADSTQRSRERAGGSTSGSISPPAKSAAPLPLSSSVATREQGSPWSTSDPRNTVPLSPGK